MKLSHALATITFGLAAYFTTAPSLQANNTPATTQAPAQNDKNKIDFEKQVWPILQTSCIPCHGQDQAKAGLRLDLPELITKNKHIVKPGNGEDSDLYDRVILDDDDGDLMPPPKFSKRLPDAQAELIKQWIDQGADFGSWMAIVNLTKPQQDAINALRQNRVFAVRLGDRVRDLRIDYRFLEKPQSAHFNLPTTLKPLVTQINYARHKLTANQYQQIASLKNLSILNLSSTNVTDQDLARLASLKKLNKLNLFNTSITAEGLKQLRKLRKLKQINIAQTKITPQQLKDLQKQFRYAKLVGDFTPFKIKQKPIK